MTALPWWRSAWATRLALVVIVLLGAYFRFLSLTDWDSGTGQHPDERFFTDVTSRVHLPGSISEYFDAARSPANPRNVEKTFFVYGTFPILVTRAAAVMLTPESALPETIPPVGSGPPQPNPELRYPTLPLLPALLNPEGANLTGYGEGLKVGRVLVALFDLGSILLVFLIGARLYDRRVGLLAALLSALAVMSIQQSHFYVDPIFSTFFTLLALYWAVRVAQGGGMGDYGFLGISIGLAMANRITLAALGAVAIVAAVQHALTLRTAGREQEEQPTDDGAAESAEPDGSRSAMSIFIEHSLPLLFLAGFLTLITFRMVQPYAFIGSQPDSPPLSGAEELGLDFLEGLAFFDVRPSPRFLANMDEVKRLVSGEADFYPSQQWVGRTDYLFPWKNMVLWGMGPALGITVWIAWAVAGWLLARRLLDVARGGEAARRLAPLVLWAWVALYFGWQGGQFASTMRYMLPIYGALIVLGSWLLVALWDWSSAKRKAQNDESQDMGTERQPAFRFALNRFAVGRWPLVLVVLLTLAWAYSFTRIYTRPHSRVMAAEWLVQHAPPGSKVTFEAWDDPLPLQATGNNLWNVRYQGIRTDPYAEDDPRKYLGSEDNPGLLNQLAEADYITLTSNRVYASATRLPMRYPVLTRYYHTLFSGELGFELAAEITSYPAFLGIPIPDQSAEEAFTVYDHPRVLIFRKTPQFSRERAEELLLERANWNEVYKLPVSVADRSATALRITESEWPLYHHAGTWSALFDPQSIVNQQIIAPLVWLLTLELLGLAAFALLFRLLPWLPDRGLSLARALGLLVVAYAAWVLGSLHLRPFTSLTVWLCALPLLAGGAWVGWRSRADLLAFWRQRRAVILSAQGLYLGAFLLMLLIRWLNPDLWHPARGGEKPMDFAYLNAVLQSGAFPPYDPWFAGGYINYYYFGFVIVGTLIHLTSIVPPIAYNLAVPTLFALTALGAWGAVYNLLAPRALPRARAALVEGRARTAALLAPFFVLVVGSLTQAFWYVDGFFRPLPVDEAQQSSRSLLDGVLRWWTNSYAAQNTHRPEWAFWDGTRIVPGTVNEFPFFTFLFADLHAHMIVMPFSLAVVGLLVALVRKGRTTGGSTAVILSPFTAIILLLGLLAGTLRATNTWDYPTFVGLTGATFALLAWRGFRRERRLVREGADVLPPALVAGRWIAIASAQLALVVIVGNLLFLPFISHFATDSSGVQFFREGLRESWLQQILDAPRTSLWDIVRMYGLWLFLLSSAGLVLAYRLSSRSSAQERGERQGRAGPLVPLAMLLAGFGIVVIGVVATAIPGRDSVGGTVDLMPAATWLLLPLLAGAAWLAWQMRRRPPRALLPLLWAGTALALCAGVEFFVVRGDVGRMNTVFKFGLHAWILYALAAAVALPWLWRKVGAFAGRWRAAGMAWRGAVVLLVVASLVYPLTATPARVSDRYAADLPHTLDGSAFMRSVDGSEAGVIFPLNEDYEAIAWMKQHIPGTPIILEAHLPSYRWAGRIATHTGLPTLLGWEWHQVQQRNAVQAGTVINSRRTAIEQIFGGQDAAQALELLRLYGIEYLYVGGVERALYPEGVAKFDLLAQQGELEQVYHSGQTTIYRVQEPDTPTVLTTDLAVQPPTADTPPPLMLDQPVDELPVVGEYAWNQWASSSSWAALLVWLLLLYALIPFGLPLAVLVFGRWRDGGFAWARLIGLLLIGYVVWLLTSLEVWQYDLWAVLGSTLLVLLLNIGLVLWLGSRAAEDTADSSQSQAPAHNHNHNRVSRLLPALRRGLLLLGAHLRAHRWPILFSEGLFLAGFLLFTGVRALNPDLWHPVWGGEKPMEFGFLNAILRSAVMPPYDPFFSDGYINYYYYGLYLVSLPIKITGIAPALAYNLVVPTVFALTLAGSYAIVAHLTGRVWYGLVGAAFVALLGNLTSVIPAGMAYGIAPIFQVLSDGNLAQLGARLGDWYVGPSRIIPFTINEFPFWTFLYADLHPHMIALPIALLAIALAYQHLMTQQEPGTENQGTENRGAGVLLLALLTALVLGTLAVTNSWDFPTYTLLTGAVMLGAVWRSHQGAGIPWRELLQAGLTAGGLALGGLALYTPFFDHFHAMVSGIGLVQDGTYIAEYLLLYGLFLAVVAPVIFGVVWRLLRLAGRRRQGADTLGSRINRMVPISRALPLLVCVLLPIILFLFSVWQPVTGQSLWLAALLALSLFIAVQRRINTALWFALLLALLAWAVSLGVELVFIRDHLETGDYYRMNTVFKFGFQVWTLLALAAAISLPTLLRGLERAGQPLGHWRHLPYIVGVVALGVLVAMTAVFPLAGTASRVANRFSTAIGPTLDGLAFLRAATFDYDCRVFPGCEGRGILQIDLSPDADAIAWLNEQIEGTPVVAQSNRWFYRAYGIRVAANTGFPTISSELHEDEQRDPLAVAQRNYDIEMLFSTTDVDTALRLLAAYDVDYIYVGAVERTFYPATGLQKFEAMTSIGESGYLAKVYEQPGTTIYQVQNIPPSYAIPEPYPFAAEEPAPVAPPEPQPDEPEQPPEQPPPLDPASEEPAADLRTLEQQVQADPGNAPLAYGLAERYRELNRLDEAARVLERAAQENPSDVALHHLWGDILRDAEQWEEAIVVYRRAAEAVPTAGNWTKLATALFEWGELEQAEEVLLRAIELDPAAPEPHFHLGQVYYYQGKREEAIGHLERYIELAPDGYLVPEARNLLQDLRQ